MEVECAAEAYVRKLEQQNRYLRILLCLVALILGSVLLMGEAGVPKVLTAEKFVLVDSEGQIRAELSAHKQASSLLLHGPDGSSVLTLQAGDQTSFLSIEQGGGISSAEIRVNTDDPHMLFLSRDGTAQSQSAADFHLHTNGAHSGSSNVDVAAGVVTDVINSSLTGWHETIDAPVVKLSRGTNEVVFVTPQPPPLRRSGK
jgi:hypothetical protein